MTMMRYLTPALLLCALLAGCATTPRSTPPLTTKPATKTGGSTAQPAKPVAVANADWVIMGVTPNGNILHEVDKLSIQRRGNLVLFRDRKTIFNPKKENFLSTPRHKQSIQPVGSGLHRRHIPPGGHDLAGREWPGDPQPHL
ncbi:hypothetical protein QF022_003625 [Vogesella perlucida]|nr:hypothetical protein [Vogesella perlucida]